MQNETAKSEFLAELGRPWMAEEIFDAVADCVFFVKDRDGRYIAVNEALVHRCGFSTKSELVGKTAREVFPAPLGERFTEQDVEVIKEGRAIHGQLELHLYANADQGWCLTWKEPILNANGDIVGLSGISRDLAPTPDPSGGDLEEVSHVLQHIESHLGESLRVSELAEKSGLSEYQFDQRIRSLFGLTAGQYVTRRRIDLACHLLERTDESIGFIGLDCGYADQSAFTRQFRQSVGMTPGAFRDRKKKD